MRQKGFSIIEVLIATTLVGTVILGVLGLLGGAIKTSAQSNNMLAASMLAQEGIELVMNIRDTNWIKDFKDDGFNNNSIDWRDGLGHPGNFKKQAGIIDYSAGLTYAESLGCVNPNTEEDLFECDETIFYLNSDNFYTHNPVGAAETKYRRIVIIEQDNGNSRLVVTSIVRWGEPTDRGKEVRLITYLYNWID